MSKRNGLPTGLSEIIRDLLTYYWQDTLAMVEIHRYLLGAGGNLNP